MAYFGPKKGVAGARAAVAVPRPPIAGGAFPRIPPPPAGAIPAAALIIGGIMAYNYLQGRREASDEAIPGDTGDTDTPSGTTRVRGVIHDDYTPDGVPSAGKGDGIVLARKEPEGTSLLKHGVSYEQEHYGEYLEPRKYGQHYWGLTKIYPPGWEPATRSPHPAAPGAAAPGTATPAPGATPGASAHPGVGGGTWSPPRLAPSNLPGVLRRGLAVRVNGRGDVSRVAAMQPGPERKVAASVSFHKFLDAWFGVGGEVIDYTRCLMYGIGATYTDKSGQERVLPRDQWMDYFHDWATQADSVVINDGVDERLQPNKVFPVLDDQAALKAANCIFKNHVQDHVMAVNSKLANQLAGEIDLLQTPFGIESMTSALTGQIPYEDLI